MSYAQASRKDSPRISRWRSHLYRFIWKPIITFFAFLWRVIWWLWGTIIIGAIVEGVIGNAAYTYSTKGHFDPIDLPNLPLIQAVSMHPLRTTFVLTSLAFLTLFSYLAHRSQQRAARDNQMGGYSLKRADQLDPNNYKLFRFVKQVYLPREADNIAQQVLRDLTARRFTTSAQTLLGICVFGRPTQGKTRLAWEAIQAEIPTWTLVTWPHDRERPFDFTTQRGQRIVLWLDDLHEFANLNEAPTLNDLPRRFAEAQAHLIILATCRDGDNKIQAQKYLGNLLERLKEISLTDISREQAILLAQGLTREGVLVQSDEFDGTPGSLLLGVQRMQRRYLDLPPSEQDILKTMKLLRSAGIYTYPESRVRSVARDLFGFDEGDWRTVCDTLDREDFVRPVHEERSLEPVADVYLERAVTTYPSPNADITDDWPQLQSSLVYQHDASGLNSLGIAYAERLLGNLRTNKRYAVECFRDALQVYTREYSPADWATTQNNLGVALSNQAGLAEGTARLELLKQAVAAYRDALQVYTREHSPADWAGTQFNLAYAYHEMISFEEDIARKCTVLRNASQCIEGVLSVFTLEVAPTYHLQAAKLSQFIKEAKQEYSCFPEADP